MKGAAAGPTSLSGMGREVGKSSVYLNYNKTWRLVLTVNTAIIYFKVELHIFIRVLMIVATASFKHQCGN